MLSAPSTPFPADPAHKNASFDGEREGRGHGDVGGEREGRSHGDAGGERGIGAAVTPPWRGDDEEACARVALRRERNLRDILQRDK